MMSLLQLPFSFASQQLFQGFANLECDMAMAFSTSFAMTLLL